jgi:hypothetical protein
MATMTVPPVIVMVIPIPVPIRRQVPRENVTAIIRRTAVPIGEHSAAISPMILERGDAQRVIILEPRDMIHIALIKRSRRESTLIERGAALD